MLKKAIITLLLSLFFVITLLFTVLISGIKINSFSLGDFSISQFYIKLNKKLIVDVKKIIIKSKKSTVNSSYEDLKKDIEILPKLLKIFERINVERLIIDGNEFTIGINDEFLYLDNKFVNLSSKVDFISNQVIFDLYSLYLKDVDLLLDGKVKIDYFNEKVDYFGNYFYGDLSGDVKADIKEQILTLYLNSQPFKSLKFLKKYLNLPEIAESWMYDNVKGDFVLKEFYGAYDLKHNELLINSLRGKAFVENAQVKFHKNVDSISTKNLEIDYANDNLSIKINEPKYLNIPLDGSSVILHNLTSEANGEVEVNIKAQHAKLDDKVHKILKAFDINIPVVQKSGTTDANLKLVFPYSLSKDMTTLGEFDVKDALISIGKFEFASKSANIELNGNKILIKDAAFKYKKMIDANANLELDIKTLQLNGDAKIKSIFIGNDNQEILNIKNFDTKLDINLDKKIEILVKSLDTQLKIDEFINVKIDDLSKIYKYSKLLKENGISSGYIDLKIKDEDNLSFNANIYNLDYPIYKNDKKIDSLNINSKVENGNLFIENSDKKLKIERKKDDILKLYLKDIDIVLEENGSNSAIPMMDVNLENSKLKIKGDTYSIKDAFVSLKPSKINFDARVYNLELPLLKNGQKVTSLDLKGSYIDNQTNIYTKNNDLNLIIKDDGVSVDLNGYDVVYNPLEEDKKDEEDTKNFSLTGKNSTILYKDKYRFVSDNYELRVRKDSKFFHLVYKQNEISFKETEDKKIDIFANNISDEFINTIYSKKILNGGKFMLLAKGKIDNFDGKFFMENTKVEDLAILNNLLLFIHTSPALINPLLAIPSLVGMATNGGFNLTGYEIINGNIEFNYNEDAQKLNIKKLLTVGNGIDFDGNGQIDLNDMNLKSKIKLIFLKDYSNIVGAIPIINYLFLGDNKRVETEVDVFGPLENPSISTNLTKDTFSVPLNIAKRILESPSKLLEFIEDQNKEQSSELLNKPKN